MPPILSPFFSDSILILNAGVSLFLCGELQQLETRSRSRPFYSGQCLNMSLYLALARAKKEAAENNSFNLK